MWEGRGGAAYGPLGRDVINLPPGPAVALLPSDDAPWPIAHDRRQRNLGGEFKGYRLDAQRQPIFMYRLGDVQIEEQPLPVPREGGVVLARKFHLTGPQPAGGKLYLLAAAGTKIEEVAPEIWKVDDKLTVRVKAPEGCRYHTSFPPAMNKFVIPPIHHTPRDLNASCCVTDRL